MLKQMCQTLSRTRPNNRPTTTIPKQLSLEIKFQRVVSSLYVRPEVLPRALYICDIFSPVRRLSGSIYAEMSGLNPSLFHHLSYSRGCELFTPIYYIFNKDAQWVL